MSVQTILENICKTNALQESYMQIQSWIVNEKRIPNLYSIDYVDLEDTEKFDTMCGRQFLIDFTDFLMYTNGFDIVIYNVPESSALKYEDGAEKVTAEHIYDTIKEIDETISDVASFAPGVYAVSCKDGMRVIELLNGKLIGENEIKVSLLKDNGKFRLCHNQKLCHNEKKEVEPEDLCTTAIVVSFFISLAFLFAFQYAFSWFH